MGNIETLKLFDLVIEAILQKVNITGHIGTKSTQILAYADDVAIMSRSKNALTDTTYWMSFIIHWQLTVICTFYCHKICKCLGSHNMRIYLMYLQYGLWTILMMVRWAKTCCQFYGLINYVLWLNIIIFYFILVLDNATGWPQTKKLKFLCIIITAMTYHHKFYILWLYSQTLNYSNTQ